MDCAHNHQCPDTTQKVWVYELDCRFRAIFAVTEAMENGFAPHPATWR
jgi:hypothetical protein